MYLRVAASAGQSLLEMVVLVGLATVIVTGLTVVTVNGLKNSQFSQNQTQATRLAQDAIDKVRTMRDQNCPVCIGGSGATCNNGTFYYWYNADDPTYGNQIWSQNLSNTTFKFIGSVYCGPAQPSGTSLQNPAAANGLDDFIPDYFKSNFSRKITISDISSSQKQVNVNVSWTDLSGTHQSNLTTIIGRNQ